MLGAESGSPERSVETLAADESNGGLGVKMTFRRVIVWPDGRKEVEGMTSPKALPVPDGDKDQ